MRLRFAAIIGSCALLASCAYQGVVVDKSARELPFSETVGTPASLSFMLRDNTGVVHRQLVTPEVFASYQVGDYFNDMQPAGSRPARAPEDKVMLTASAPSVHASAPITRVAVATPPTKHVASPTPKHSTKLAAKKHKSHRSLAARKRASQHLHRAMTTAKPHPVEAPAEPAAPVSPAPPGEGDIVDIGPKTP